MHLTPYPQSMPHIAQADLVKAKPRGSVGSVEELRQEVAGSILWLGQYSFQGLMIVTGFIPLSPLVTSVFSFFPQCFQKPSPLWVVKTRDFVVEG